jgi:hypothetical protein
MPSIITSLLITVAIDMFEGRSIVNACINKITIKHARALQGLWIDIRGEKSRLKKQYQAFSYLGDSACA